ncbi:hypothetical protein EON65_03785 [archaeon]|nr:MAG: hypothetical protein EON65_03785 [archaeon]
MQDKIAQKRKRSQKDGPEGTHINPHTSDANPHPTKRVRVVPQNAVVGRDYDDGSMKMSSRVLGQIFHNSRSSST